MGICKRENSEQSVYNQELYGLFDLGQEEVDMLCQVEFILSGVSLRVRVQNAVNFRVNLGQESRVTFQLSL